MRTLEYVPLFRVKIEFVRKSYIKWVEKNEHIKIPRAGKKNKKEAFIPILA